MALDCICSFHIDGVAGVEQIPRRAKKILIKLSQTSIVSSHFLSQKGESEKEEEKMIAMPPHYGRV